MKVGAVYVTAAPALSDDRDSQLFHDDLSSFRIGVIQKPDPCLLKQGRTNINAIVRRGYGKVN